MAGLAAPLPIDRDFEGSLAVCTIAVNSLIP
jgi:hypothetical protein